MTRKGGKTFANFDLKLVIRWKSVSRNEVKFEIWNFGHVDDLRTPKAKLRFVNSLV